MDQRNANVFWHMGARNLEKIDQAHFDSSEETKAHLISTFYNDHWQVRESASDLNGGKAASLFSWIDLKMSKGRWIIQEKNIYIDWVTVKNSHASIYLGFI